MKAYTSLFNVFTCGALAFGVLLVEPTNAQTERPGPGGYATLPWENSRVRLTRVSAEPGATLPAAGNQVLVYLTADPDGRVPAEAVWQPSGAGGALNRGRVRLEALAIELKDQPPGSSSRTRPEGFSEADAADVSILIDNPQVLVARHRYSGFTNIGPLRVHPEDVVIVYLRGGYAWPITEAWGAERVSRGDVDVIPANTFHRPGNAGSDPLEFLVIVPR